MTFSTTSVTVLKHVLIDSAATRTTVADAIRAASFMNGSTNMSGGFNALETVLADSSASITATYVNLATDGVPDNTTATVTARNAIIAAGVDNISVEGIGSGVNVSFLQCR